MKRGKAGALFGDRYAVRRAASRATAAALGCPAQHARRGVIAAMRDQVATQPASLTAECVGTVHTARKGTCTASPGTRTPLQILTPRKLFILPTKVSVFPSTTLSLQEATPRYDDARGTIHLDVSEHVPCTAPCLCLHAL